MKVKLSWYTETLIWISSLLWAQEHAREVLVWMKDEHRRGKGCGEQNTF